MNKIVYEYVLPDIPPSYNVYMGRNPHYRQYGNIKESWEQKISLLCNPKPQSPIEYCRITLTYHFPDRKRRDPDNYSGKFLLDGLRKAGIIKDDTFMNVELILKAVFGCSKSETHIKIEEVKKN